MEELKNSCSSSLGAVIIASGISDRNGTDQALYEVKGMTLAKYVTVNFRRAGIKDFVIITGEQNDLLKKDLKGYGVTFLQAKKDTESEMMDSVKLGLKYLEERCDKVFVCPVYVPFFQKETILKLLEKNSPVTIPSYQGRGGHPVLLTHRIFKDLYAYRGEMGLKGFIQSMEQPPEYVETDDPGISYSKAWTMIHTAEEELGQELVRRQPGGKNGGTAELTETGWELIKKYEQLEASIEKFAAKEYQRIFGR